MSFNNHAIANPTHTHTHARHLDDVSFTSLELGGTTIDCKGYKSLRLLGTGTADFNVYGSIDDVNYFRVALIYVETNVNHLGHYTHHIEHPPRYIKVKNGSVVPNNITLDYSLLN